MSLTITQIFFSLFLLFALSRVFLRFRDGTLHLIGYIFWSCLFGMALLVILFPGLSSIIAHVIGIGRGTDVIIYASITLLFYLVFRIYVYLEDIRHDITDLVQKLALKEIKKENVKETSQN